MKKTIQLASTTVLLGATLPEATAATIYNEEFTIPGSSNVSFASEGWSVYFLDDTGSVNDLSANASVPALVQRNDYGYTVTNTSSNYSNGPALMFTTEPAGVLDSTDIGDLTQLSVDVLADGSPSDSALGRMTIRIGSQWYATDLSTTSDTNTGPSGTYLTFAVPALFDFTDGNNWRSMTVTTGAGGEITVAGSTVGGTLSGNVNAFGMYAINGNAGDHFRIDNYTVTTSVPEPSSLCMIGLAGFGIMLRRRR